MLQGYIKNVFVQLSDSIDQLTDAQYTTPVTILNNATIGQHVRHIIELFQCLENGYGAGLVNYEKRKRDLQIETNTTLAKNLLVDILKNLDRPDKELLLESAYDDQSNDTITVKSNFYREVIYNLEHTVHHMALIRVGITAVADITLPSGYGVASSTIKYRKTACAQ